MRFPAVFCAAAVLLPAASARASDVLATLRAGHPRLLLTDERLAANLAAARSDSLRAEVHSHIARLARAQWDEPPIEHRLDGPRLLDQSRKAIAHVLTNAMAYRLTGDARYAQFAARVMLRAAAFPDWNPSHFLDVAEMATALALGYDWLFHRLTPDERAAIGWSLVNKALVFARPAYARSDPRRESFPFVGNNLHNNWNQVCNGGFVLAALALADEEPELARIVLDGVRETLPYALAAYRPDGAYPEGPVYGGFGTRYPVYLLAALETALGDDLGLGDAPAFDRTALYRLHMWSPTGQSFNYADGKPRLGADDALTWLAQRYDHPYVLATNRAWLAQLLHEPPNDETDRFIALHAAWFPAAAANPPSPPLDAQFRGPAQLAVFRSAWDDPRALWVGFKAGSNAVNHAHLDLGTFTLDADGVRWAIDLGRDDYNLPGYWERESATSRRWQYFRLNNHGHNTLTPGARLQEPAAVAPLVAFGSTPARAFAVADLTAAYPGAAQRLRRGLTLLDRSRVLVQDDVSGLAAGTPLSWRMLTEAGARLESPRAAVLARDGRRLRVELLSPAGARFTLRPATPPTRIENQNAGATLLEAEIPASPQAVDVRLAVLLTPLGEKWPERARPELIALDEWK